MTTDPLARTTTRFYHGPGCTFVITPDHRLSPALLGRVLAGRGRGPGDRAYPFGGARGAARRTVAPSASPAAPAGGPIDRFYVPACYRPALEAVAARLGLTVQADEDRGEQPFSPRLPAAFAGDTRGMLEAMVSGHRGLIVCPDPAAADALLAGVVAAFSAADLLVVARDDAEADVLAAALPAAGVAAELLRPRRGRPRSDEPPPVGVCVVAARHLGSAAAEFVGRWAVVATDADAAAGCDWRLFRHPEARVYGLAADDDAGGDLLRLSRRLRCFGEPIFRASGRAPARLGPSAPDGTCPPGRAVMAGAEGPP